MVKIKNTLPSKTPTYFEYSAFLKENSEVKKFQSLSYYLKKYGYMNSIFDALPCAIYMLDYQAQQYLFVSKNCETILGYTADDFMKKGNAFFVKNIHPDDFAIYSSKVFKNFIGYTSSLSADEIKQSRFSLNYRIKRKDGIYIQVLQQYIVAEVNEQNNPVLAIGFLSDITAHKNDNKVTFSISKYDKKTGFSMITTDSFPNVDLAVTVREKQVIKFLIEGLGSKQIADKLHISLHTVTAHRRNLLKKTNCKNTAELINHVISNGLA